MDAEPAERLAEELIAILPDPLACVFYSDSGLIRVTKTDRGARKVVSQLAV